MIRYCRRRPSSYGKGLLHRRWLPIAGQNRRLTEAAGSFRQGNRILWGPLQLSFFDTHPAEMDI